MARINLGHVKGTGIKAVIEYFGLSKSNTTEPTNWQTTCPLMTDKDKYLWSYSIIQFDDNKTDDIQTNKRVIGTYGDHGTLWSYGTSITGSSKNPTVFPDSGISYAVLGDAYVNIETWDVYECVTGGDANTATWRYLNNIKGETGDNGISGIEYYENEPTSIMSGMTWIGN
ncbi:MAG: hypothetical protein NC321_12880 [Clostridium sp.]|nr:hypothetical protein [Clostridium sp.]